MDIILETPGTRVSKKQEMLKLDVPNAPQLFEQIKKGLK